MDNLPYIYLVKRFDTYSISAYWKYLTTTACLKYSALLIVACLMIIIVWPLNKEVQIAKQEYFVETTIANFSDEPRIESSSAADSLPLNGSIFCWVLTSPKYFQSRVLAVNETWLKRCDHGQFFTTEPMNDTTIPYTTVFAGLDDSYGALFYKTTNGFYYAFTEISENFDWYMKADDDSYVIMENLREYLSQFNPKEPYYIGYTFKPYLPNGYNSGGAGYVLSNAAVRIFVEELYANRTICPYNASEDVGLAVCLANKGIYPEDSRNKNAQHRFSPYSMKQIFDTEHDNYEYTKWPEKRRYDAFAPELITFHHQTPAELRMIEILLYRLNDPRLSKYHKA